MKKFLLITVIFLLNSTELRSDKKKCIEDLLKYGVSSENINGFIKIADSLDSYSQSTIPQMLYYLINCYDKILNDKIADENIQNERDKTHTEISDVFIRGGLNSHNSNLIQTVLSILKFINPELAKARNNNQMKINLLKEFYMMYYPDEEENTVILGGYDMGKFLPKFE